MGMAFCDTYYCPLQGLDEQPGVYSLDEFIRGAANAIRGVFPQVGG